MPNYTLSSTLIEALCSVAQELCTRRLRHAETGFPLTANQVQRMTLPAKWRASILEMKAEKLEFLSNNYVHADFIKAVVGIKRVSGHFIYVNYQQSFDASALSSHTIDGLNKWLDNAIIEKKMADLSVKTINAFLRNGYGATVGHITVRWPGLKLLVSNSSMADRYFSNRIISDWKQKLADPPKRLSMYGWDRDPKAMEFYKKYAKAMRLADMVMATGQMLPKEITDSGELKASIYSLAE